MRSSTSASPETGHYGVSAQESQRMVDYALRRNPVVKFMTEKLEEAGCPVGEGFFKIENCSEQVGGGFRPGEGVVICHNHLGTQEEIGHALVHELVHAFDHCRGADLDWRNCAHHACSEVRAASLSGDCHFKQELLRGNLGFRAQHQACVKRRAQLSVAMNPHCAGRNQARRAVDATFDACFADTAPFDRIP